MYDYTLNVKYIKKELGRTTVIRIETSPTQPDTSHGYRAFFFRVILLLHYCIRLHIVYGYTTFQLRVLFFLTTRIKAYNICF